METVLINDILIAIICLMIAIMDLVSFKFKNTPQWMKPQFWNPVFSWLNKWGKNDTTKERFWGSSTVFVFLTDGWHLCKFIMLNCVFIIAADTWVDFIIYWAIYTIIFNSIYNRKKKS